MAQEASVEDEDITKGLCRSVSWREVEVVGRFGCARHCREGGISLCL